MAMNDSGSSNEEDEKEGTGTRTVEQTFRKPEYIINLNEKLRIANEQPEASPLKKQQPQQLLENDVNPDDSNNGTIDDDKQEEKVFEEIGDMQSHQLGITGVERNLESCYAQESTDSPVEMAVFEDGNSAGILVTDGTSHEELKNEQVANWHSEETDSHLPENKLDDDQTQADIEEENGWADFISPAKNQIQSSQQSQSSAAESAISGSKSNDYQDLISQNDSDNVDNDDFGTFEEPLPSMEADSGEERDHGRVRNSQKRLSNDQALPQSSESVMETSQNEIAAEPGFGFTNFSSVDDNCGWADFGGAAEMSNPANQTDWPSTSFSLETSHKVEPHQQQPLDDSEVHSGVISTLQDNSDDFGDPVAANVTSPEENVTPFNQFDDVIDASVDDDFVNFSTGAATNDSFRGEVVQQQLQMNGYVSCMGMEGASGIMNDCSVAPDRTGGVVNDSNSCVYSPCSYACIEGLLDAVDFKANSYRPEKKSGSALVSEEPLLLQDFFASMSIASHLSKQISEDVEVVWALVANLCNSSSLLLDCEDSFLNQQLLASLGVDISNALSAVKQNLPKYAAQLGLLQPVRSAVSTGSDSNLVTSLGVLATDEGGATSVNVKSDGVSADRLRQRQKPINNNKDSSLVAAPDAVPDVEFDWRTSGLKNPLEIPSLNLDFFDSQFSSSSAASALSQLEDELLNACGGPFDEEGEAASSTTSSGSHRTGGGRANKDSRLASILAAAQSSTAQESVSVVVGNTFRAMPPPAADDDKDDDAIRQMLPNITDPHLTSAHAMNPICCDVDTLDGLSCHDVFDRSLSRSGSSSATADVHQAPNGANLCITHTATHLGQRYSPHCHYGAQQNVTNYTAAKNTTDVKEQKATNAANSSTDRGGSSFAQRYCVPPVRRSNYSTSSAQPTTSSTSSKWSRWFSRK